MKYVICKYLRISEEDIDLDGLAKHESDSIVNQRLLIDDYISKMPEVLEMQNGGFKVEVLEELDDGKSGTNFSRPGVQRLLELAELGKIQCIIVKDISRWGRNYLEVGDFLEQKFPAWGVRFISIGDMYDSQALGGSTGGIDMAFRGLIAQMYSKDLSMKVRAGKNAAAKSGKIVTTYPTYGYDKDKNDRHKFVINPAEAAIVKRIFDQAEQGVSVAEIIRRLNYDNIPTIQTSKQQKGIKTTWGRGDCWGRWVVSSILRDEKYTGKWIWGKTRLSELGGNRAVDIPRSEWIIIDGAIPAIISENQFDAVQEILKNSAKKRTKTTSNGSIFKRKIKCGDCGRAMSYQTRKDKSRVYICNMHTLAERYNCKSGRVEESHLQEIALATIQAHAQLALDEKTMLKNKAKANIGMEESIYDKIRALQLFVGQAKAKKVALWEQFHNGEITLETFQGKSKKLTSEIEIHESNITKLQNKAQNLETISQNTSPAIEKYGGLAGIQELTFGLVNELINEIRIYSLERIEIIWKFGDVFEKIARL